MQFVVSGKVFDDIEEAKKYEEEVRLKRQKEENDKKEKERRFKELKELEKKYVEEVNKFYKDYGYYEIDLNGIPNSFDKLFDDFCFDIFKN